MLAPCHSVWVVDHSGLVPRDVWCKYGNLASTPRYSRAFFSRRVHLAWVVAAAAAVRFWFITDKYWCLTKNIHLKSTTAQVHKTPRRLPIHNIPPGRNVTAVIYRCAAVGIYTQIYRINVIIKCVCVENKI